MTHHSADTKDVKQYLLKPCIPVTMQFERDRILREYSDTVFACRDAGITPPPPPVVGFPPKNKTRQQLLIQEEGKPTIVSSQKLYPCGDVWEHYEFFDEQSHPLYFKSGYTLPPRTIEEVVEDAIEDAKEREFDAFVEELKDIIDACLAQEGITLDRDGKRPISEDEKQAERQRYIGKVKKRIRRLVNANRLYYMYTLTFALEKNENVKGLHFILPEDDQRDREKVLAVWNTRLTDIRRWLKQQYGRDFRFVLVLEKHDGEDTDPRKRGTYHLHLATDKPLDKHELQQHWGYGVVWIDDFKKNKKRDKTTGRVFNETSDFLRDPGRYLAKYLEKEIDNPKFLNKHAYSSSRDNLKRPENLVIRDEDEIARILKNPSLAFKRGDIPESVYQKIKHLTSIDEVKTYSNEGNLKRVDIPLKKRDGEPDVMVLYVKYTVYNFRLLYPGARWCAPRSQLEFFPTDMEQAA